MGLSTYCNNFPYFDFAPECQKGRTSAASNSLFAKTPTDSFGRIPNSDLSSPEDVFGSAGLVGHPCRGRRGGGELEATDVHSDSRDAAASSTAGHFDAETNLG